VLLVESNPHSLSVRRMVLHTWGYSVTLAEDASQALERVREGPAEYFNAVVSEVLLTGMDGNDLAARLKSLRPEIRVLLFSTIIDGVDRGCAADRFLPKAQFTHAELKHALEMMVSRKRGPKPVTKASPAEMESRASA
jgi:CheY-like chemotaxis protein